MTRRRLRPAPRPRDHREPRPLQPVQQRTTSRLAERLLGSRDAVERFHCAYGPVPGLPPRLTEAGMRFTAHDPEGAVRVAELPGHPFYLATFFQPEPAGHGAVPHPYVRALAEAAVTHAAQANSLTSSRFDEHSPAWPVHR